MPSPGQTKLMSSQPSSSSFGAKSLLILTAILAVVLVPLFYSSNLGNTPKASGLAPVPELQQSVPEPSAVSEEPSPAVVSENVEEVLSSVVDAKPAVFSYKRFIVAGLATSVVMVALAAALIFYQSYQSDQSDVISEIAEDPYTKEQRLLEEQRRLEEEEQMRLEAEAKEKREFRWKLAIGSVVLNFVVAVVYIIILQKNGPAMSYNEMAGTLFVCIAMQQGITILLLAIFGALFNACVYVLKNWSVPIVRHIAYGIAYVAARGAILCSIASFPVLAFLAYFASRPARTLYGNVWACKNNLASMRSWNDPLPSFKWD